MASMSRWLVGSSSSSTSGCGDQRARQQHAAPPAARQRVDRRVGAAGRARSSTISTRCSSRQPSRSSSSCCSRPSRSSAAGVASCATSCGGVVVGGDELAQLAEALGDDVEHRLRRWRAARPARAARRARRAGARPCPRRAAARRAMICSRVDLPVPLRPMTRDPLAGIDLEGDAIEQRQVAEGDGNGIQGEKGHCRRAVVRPAL